MRAPVVPDDGSLRFSRSRARSRRLLLFVLSHFAALLLLLLVSAAAGTAIAGSRVPLALRATLGLAALGQALVLAAICGLLNVVTIVALCAASVIGGAMRGDLKVMRVEWRATALIVALTAPLFLLALQPPLAFDETLYHLPFITAAAESGALEFHPELRFPAFPQLQEMLSVPLFLALGDTATHLVSLAQLLLLGGIVYEWAGRHVRGLLAAALVAGNPIVLHLATIGYVDLGLTLFIAAAFYCIDRSRSSRSIIAAGFLLATACSIKYLGWYFVPVAAALLLLTETWRQAARLIVATLLAATPMYATIIALSGNPLFPFLPRVFGASQWAIPSTGWSPDTWNVLWNITFARELVNHQPPYSPLFALSVIAVVGLAWRGRAAALLAAACVGYLAIFAFLPQDSRYLLPLVPLTSVPLARMLANYRRTALLVILLATCGGVAYSGYRIARMGLPPRTQEQRREVLRRQLPEYRAIERTGDERVFACGAEQLQHFAPGVVLGDVSGPWSAQRILGASRTAHDLARRLDVLDVRYVLVSRRACPPTWQNLPAPPYFELVHEDENAMLWRLRGFRF